MGADETALRRDLKAVEFRIGAHRGHWVLKGLVFPYALFFVAAPSRARGPSGFLLRAECRGYSGTAPTSQLWHGGKDAPLEPAHRPHGPQGLMSAFSTWGNCLYLPIDRLARDHWGDQFADQKWTPDKTINFLLETVHGVLASADYSHADLPAEALVLPQAFVGTDSL